ncbi:hypothetical protein F4809DRAFT_611270 [Biscogniauxia mediterranea]|nr:hypothetical protein F4809DRAFT_611270 [Biscogniauxia mediterranea]
MSDESDRQDHTASSEPGELDGDEYSSDQSGSDATNPLLDVEAVESDGESDDETAGEFDEHEPYFPQFCRLPIELRERIWEYFDPNLTCKARVFDVTLVSSPVELWDGPTLDQQTEPARAMLATHRESRALVLKRYPDTLYLRNKKSMVRLNAEQDIVLLSGEFDAHRLRTVLSTSLSDCGVKSIALAWNDDVPSERTRNMLCSFLENESGVRIYICRDAITFSGRDLQPFVSDSAQKYYMQTREEEEGLGEDSEYMYCWNAGPMGDDYAGREPGPRDMVKFCFMEGIRRFDKIKNAMSIEGPWEDKWQSDSEKFDSDMESEADDYELDGFVVNSESDESEGSDNNDEDGEEDDDDMEGGTRLDDDVSSFNGFSPLQDEDEDMGNDRDLPAAHFSSLEPDSPRSDGLEDQEVSESAEQPMRNIRTSNRHIISSDDAPESEEGNTRMPQSANSGNVLELRGRPGPRTRTKRRIASSDDDDEDEDGPKDGHEDKPVKKARHHKRAHVIMSDSEDEDEEEGDGRHTRSRKLDDEDDESSQGDSDSATEEEEEEEEDSSDEEPVKAKPVSLLDRLRRFKSDNPISPSGSDDESVASAASDNIDDNDEDESDTERGEIGMYADMDAEQDYDQEEDEGEW